jgi:mono/diheme cytochrome c family protein
MSWGATLGRADVRALSLVVAAVLLSLSVSPSATAAEKGLAGKGKLIVTKNCSRCHAVGVEGDSPNPQAPPFRTLSSKYPVEDLAESLAEGIVSGHPEMPVFVFTPHEIDAIIAYLQSIQTGPPAGKQPED